MTIGGSAGRDPAALAAIDAFELAWRRERPVVAEYLRRHPQPPRWLLVELVAIDLENRIKVGDVARVEEYVETFPVLAEDSETLLDLLRVEHDFRRRTEPDLLFEDCLRRFPECAAAASRSGGDGTGSPTLDDTRGDAAGLPIGTRIGGVTLVRMIAEGGMGRVYEGAQERPRRTVAVKIIKPGLLIPSMLRRFEREADVLASLRHPGIAQIHAVGTHHAGGRMLPYFVMEYVPAALPLTQFAADRGLSPRRRLQLFHEVCEAVAHGHQKGVIHRDLKPGNVLVDSSGRTKVIDFGVARSTAADIASTTTQTHAGALVGTPQYMSPEQFDADPADIDVRLDVYALGVILHELLTGRPPYDVRQRPIHEVARIVREEPPPPMKGFDRRIHRDVAIITAKCLEKDRTRRYSSATELAADIGRHLAGEPIAAEPPTIRDVLLRLAWRHRVAAVAGGAIVATLVAAVVGISAFAIRAERERIRAVAASERADSESRMAIRRLYVANLYRIGDLAQTASYGAGRALLEETLALRAGGERGALAAADAPLPLELRILAAELEPSLAVLDAGRGLRSLVFSDDGRLIAAGDEEGAVSLWDVTTALRDGGRPAFRWLAGRGGAVQSVEFSGDGSRLLTAGADRVARVWDVASPNAVGPLVSLVGHEGPLERATFSPDGRSIATCSWDGTARLWDTARGVVRVVLRGGRGRMSHVAFSPDGSLLATGDGEGTARIHDADTGAERVVLAGHGGQLYGLSWSPDNALIATASLDRTARVWDARTGECRHLLEGHEGWVRAVAFSSDGMLIATASEDGTTRTWDSATGALLTTIAHDSPVSGVRFSPDGRQLLARTANLAASVWDRHAGEPQYLRGHTAPISGLSFSPDGAIVATASADGTIRLWDAARSGRLPSLDFPPSRRVVFQFSPDGGLFAAAAEDGSIRVWDAATGDERLLIADVPGRRSGISFTPDGRRLAVHGAAPGSSTTIWDIGNGERIASLGAGYGVLKTGVLSPEGMRLLTRLPQQQAPPESGAGGLAAAAVWAVPGGERIALLHGHEQFIAAGAFSPDGRRVATASYDETVRLWDATTGDVIATLTGHEDWVTGVDFTVDGSLVVTSSKDGTARSWDAATGSPRRVFPATIPATRGRPGGVLLHAISPDGTRLALADADRVVGVWDVSSARRIASCRGHTHQIVMLLFSPDGTRLATASTDTTARLWDPETGEELVKLRHGAAVECMAFSPDGACLATAARNAGSIRLWGRSPSRSPFARGPQSGTR